MAVRLGKDLNLNEAGRAEPKYRRLKHHLVLQLREGRLQPGEPLPTELELASTYGVARSTVRQALGELDREGLIRHVRGRRTFVGQDAQRPLNRALNVFALVLPETQTGQYPAMQHGFERASAEAHNQMIVSSTENDVAKQGNVILQLLQNKVGGVAIVPVTTPATPAYQIQMLRRQDIPVVFCHRRVQGTRAPLLAIPYHQVTRTAGEAFLRQGHRRAAIFITGPVGTVSRAYTEGLRQSLRAGGGDLPEEFVHHGNMTSTDVSLHEEDVRQSLEQMFSHPDPPTAIMASFDSLAELIYLLLDRLGLRVPEDVSLVGFGGKSREGAIIRQLTSVVIDGAEVGRRAGELLQQMRRSRRAMDDNEEIVIPLGMSEGRTLGRAPETSKLVKKG